MNRIELETSWAKTTKHLTAARALLPDNPPPGADGATLAGFEECLRQKEMELAMDELEDLGLTSHPVSEFWRHLAYAAENMGLTERATEFRRRMERT